MRHHSIFLISFLCLFCSCQQQVQKIELLTLKMQEEARAGHRDRSTERDVLNYNVNRRYSPLYFLTIHKKRPDLENNFDTMLQQYLPTNHDGPGATTQANTTPKVTNKAAATTSGSSAQSSSSSNTTSNRTTTSSNRTNTNTNRTNTNTNRTNTNSNRTNTNSNRTNTNSNRTNTNTNGKNTSRPGTGETKNQHVVTDENGQKYILL